MWAAYKDNDIDLCDISTDCSHCDDVHRRKECAKEWLEEVIDQLYSHKELDRAKLENALDELCGYLGVKTSPGDLMIERFSEIHYEWKPKIPGV